MSTQVIKSNTPTANRPYINDKNESLRKAGDCLLLMMVVFGLLSLIEMLIYGPIISSKNYGGVGWQNALLSYGIPVIAAFGIIVISFLAKPLRANESVKWFCLIGIMVVLACEVLFFWWGWNLRAEAAGGGQFADFMNIVAVIAFVLALYIDLYLSRKQQLHLAEATIYGVHEKFNSTERGIAPFRGTSAIDLNRALQDFNELKRCYQTVADFVMTNLKLSRAACAKLYATSPEQELLAQELPYDVNGTAYKDYGEARKAILQYLDAPDDSRFRALYGPDLNLDLDRRAREAIANHRTRYNKIIASHKGVASH